MRDLFRLIVKNYFVLLFLFLEAIALVLIFQFNPFQKSFIINVSRNVSTTLNSKVTGVKDYLFLHEENDRLINENAILRNQLSKTKTLVYLSVPDSLVSDTIEVNSKDRFLYKPAEIVSSSVNKQYNYLTINKGFKENIEKDMAVISSEGVVGMILATSNNFATIQPLINRNSRTGARLRGNNYFGVLDWDGRSPNYAQLKEIPVHAELLIGDTIETSGFSSVYPKGLPIGLISGFQKGKGNFYDIEIQLFVNFNTINHVLVLNNIFLEERRELERKGAYD